MSDLHPVIAVPFACLVVRFISGVSGVCIVFLARFVGDRFGWHRAATISALTAIGWVCLGAARSPDAAGWLSFCLCGRNPFFSALARHQDRRCVSLVTRWSELGMNVQICHRDIRVRILILFFSLLWNRLLQVELP